LLGHFGARRYSALRSTVARGSANHAPMTTLPQDSTTPRQRLQVVLFDIDGTLLDSNDAHVESWLAALRRHGHAVEREQVRRMIGKGGDKMVQELAGLSPDDPAAKALSAMHREMLMAELPKLRPTPGARALLERLRADGLHLVAATSASGSELDALLRQADVADLIEAAASASDAEHSKPDPDIVIAALKKAGAAAAAAVMIGDTPYDIEAARAAGVAAVALRCGGGWGDEAFSGALAVYDDPADLLRRLDASPLAAPLGKAS
jgi:HAD superfamily hydrolase (TIGR01509 family)